MAEARQQSKDSDGGVEIQSCGEADGGQQREEFAGRNFEDVEHLVRENISRNGARSLQGEIKPGTTRPGSVTA